MATCSWWLAVTLLASIALAEAHAGDAKELNVTIRVNYSAPADFTLQPPNYRAASSVVLVCEIVGLDGPALSYNWTSTCSGNCFVRGRTTQSVQRRVLRSIDSGVHTCIATDGSGCSGNASIEMNVVGAGIYVHSQGMVLPNNSMIIAAANQYLPEFHCLSGSRSGNVGQFIGVNGLDITNWPGDAFGVIVGGSNNPGTLEIHSHGPISYGDQGVYTCRMPDENGASIDVNMGLYQHGFSTLPRVMRLEKSDSLYPLKLTCVSTGSPPTTVIWMKDGRQAIIDGSSFKLSQTLVNRATSTCNNMLIVSNSSAVIGKYSCSIRNSMGSSTPSESVTVEALQITGHEHPVLVGLSAEINCSTKLTVTKLEWLLVGIDFPVETSDDQSVILTLEPESIGLNGAMFTCKVTTVDGATYEETVTVAVKELENNVVINAPQMPISAGQTYTINCIVTSDITPTVKWIDSSGNPPTDSYITVGSPVVSGNQTVLSLTFDPLHTSHGGRYRCVSVVDHPQSVQTATQDVTVKIPQPTVYITRIPDTAVVYTSQTLNLTCYIEIDDAVDTGMRVSSAWSGPAGAISGNSRITVVDPTGPAPVYRSLLNVDSLRSSDSGDYMCNASVAPLPSSVYVVVSEETSDTIDVTIVLKVMIQITYSPPPEPTNFEPPNYRPGTAVSLTCTALGATGSVTYRWTSTCTHSSCFVRNQYYSQTISTSILHWYDDGYHTCTATDSSGNTGSNSTTMNITGAGIYVTESYRRGFPGNAQPNNSLVIPNDNYYYSSHRLEFYCFSNSSAGYDGQLITPVDNVVISRYTGNRSPFYVSTSSTDGYVYFYIRGRSYSGSYFRSGYDYGYQGIYTCQLPDSRGVQLEISIGIYSYSFRSPPVVTSLQYNRSRLYFTLNCTSTTSPPTNVTWTRDGELLKMDGTNYRLTQIVTSRRSSTYDNILEVDDTPDNIIGSYTCNVSNIFGSNTSSQVTITGLQILSSGELQMGDTVNISCSTDLSVTGVQWVRQYRNGSSSVLATSTSQTATLVLDPVSTNMNDTTFTCRSTSPYGIQEKSINTTIAIPESWGRVSITSVTADPIEGRRFEMACVVTAVGLDTPPVIQWLYPDGTPVSGENITVGTPVVVGYTTTLSLVFNPLNTSHGGDYTCRATINIPGFDPPGPQFATTHLVVTSQALFQLKFGPVQYCVQWSVEKAKRTDRFLRAALAQAIRDRCNCPFEDDAIVPGEFSCQTSTTQVVYRSNINGTSDTRHATELLPIIEDWVANEGTFVVDVFRMRVNTGCPLHFTSFHEPECSNTTLAGSGAGYCLGKCLESVLPGPPISPGN